MTSASRLSCFIVFFALLTVSCGDFPTDGSVTPTTGGGFTTPTTDITLESLATACQAGSNGAACDELWQLAPVGSELERIGASCGGAIDVGGESSFGNCVELFATTLTSLPTSTSPGPTTSAPEFAHLVNPTTGNWVVVLRSVSSGEPVDVAIEYAEQLQAEGIDAKVFLSDDFGSLNPGFWVVYTGEFTDPAGATERCGELLGSIEESCYERFVGSE